MWYQNIFSQRFKNTHPAFEFVQLQVDWLIYGRATYACNVNLDLERSGGVQLCTHASALPAL